MDKPDWADRSRQDQFLFKTFRQEAASVIRTVEFVEAGSPEVNRVAGGIAGDMTDVSSILELRNELGPSCDRLIDALSRLKKHIGTT